MKKWLLVLGMITCIFGMSACGSEKAEETFDYGVSEEEILTYTEAMILDMISLSTDETRVEEKAQSVKASPMVASAVSSWESSQDDIGSYGEFLEKEATFNEDGVIANLKLDGSEHDANIEVIFDSDLVVTSITTNVEYSFGEMMEKAALNTLLGMGTVFVVLILICLIISCFAFIPKIQAAFAKKPKEEEKQTATATVDNTIAQIVEKEELSDDLELVAVIAAAIAASEGAASTDGFVVRSIRKRRY